MRIAVATLESISRYSQSRFVEEPKLDGETPDKYERRTWLLRCHTTDDGHIFIPPMQFKKALVIAGQMLRMPIPGKGKSEYGKHIKAGVLVTDPLVLPVKVKDMDGEWLYMDANGKPGGSRVRRCYPYVERWSGQVSYKILDNVISRTAFEQHLEASGDFVGIGRFRPANGGFYGRFKVNAIEWKEK